METKEGVPGGTPRVRVLAEVPYSDSMVTAVTFRGTDQAMPYLLVRWYLIRYLLHVLDASRYTDTLSIISLVCLPATS